MKKNYGIFVLLSVAMGLTACDDGSIPRKEHTATHTGFAAKLTGHITGADSWPEYYQLVLAGFGDSEYATTQVLVSPDANSNVSLTLPNIGSNVKTIELCVTNRLRKRVLTYQRLLFYSTITVSLNQTQVTHVLPANSYYILMQK